MNLKPFKLTEAQRKATLRDGQNAGELLLDIEGRIGEIALKEPKKEANTIKDHSGRIMGKIPTNKRKHERLGIPSQKKMQQSQQIAKHPEIVEKVKAQASMIICPFRAYAIFH